uniref:Uncharacterized protein n=1 Tax=Anguilla anguilla TaxID=7936 RepID=A0A0E9WK35_ANGAN
MPYPITLVKVTQLQKVIGSKYSLLQKGTFLTCTVTVSL